MKTTCSVLLLLVLGCGPRAASPEPAPPPHRPLLEQRPDLLGVSREDVKRKLGAPDDATDRLWKYYNRVRNQHTGRPDTLLVYFRDDKVSEVR